MIDFNMKSREDQRQCWEATVNVAGVRPCCYGQVWVTFSVAWTFLVLLYCNIIKGLGSWLVIPSQI